MTRMYQRLHHGSLRTVWRCLKPLAAFLALGASYGDEPRLYAASCITICCIVTQMTSVAASTSHSTSPIEFVRSHSLPALRFASHLPYRQRLRRKSQIIEAKKLFGHFFITSSSSSQMSFFVKVTKVEKLIFVLQLYFIKSNLSYLSTLQVQWHGLHKRTAGASVGASSAICVFSLAAAVGKKSQHQTGVSTLLKFHNMSSAIFQQPPETKWRVAIDSSNILLVSFKRAQLGPHLQRHVFKLTENHCGPYRHHAGAAGAKVQCPQTVQAFSKGMATAFHWFFELFRLLNRAAFLPEAIHIFAFGASSGRRPLLREWGFYDWLSRRSGVHYLTEFWNLMQRSNCVSYNILSYRVIGTSTSAICYLIRTAESCAFISSTFLLR